MVPSLCALLFVAATVEVKPGGSIAAALSKLTPGEPNRLVLLAGDHLLKEPIALDARHNGLTLQGKGQVRLIGGALVHRWVSVDANSGSRLRPEARAKVIVADLPVPAAPLRSRGFGRPTTPSHTELFFDGKRMTLARWPNTGSFERIAATADPNPPDDGHGKPWREIGPRAK